MFRERFNWNLLLKVVHRYRADAERCLEGRAYFAGLVCVRACLETLLMARIVLEVLDWPKSELDEYGVTVKDDVVEVPERVNVAELIRAAYEQGLVDRCGLDAADRIREWGNKIHCSRLAGGTRLPSIGARNLEARLGDLGIVAEELARTV